MEWRNIPGWPEYQVSDNGVVRRACQGNNWPRGKILKPSRANGYLKVHLHRYSIAWVYSVHALVCSAFHGPSPTPSHQVAHWDGVKTNNLASNLRWALPTENAQDRDRHGRTARGEKSGASRMTTNDIQLIRQLFRPRPRSNSAELARRFGITQTHVRRIAARQTWEHLP